MQIEAPQAFQFDLFPPNLEGKVEVIKMFVLSPLHNFIPLHAFSSKRSLQIGLPSVKKFTKASRIYQRDADTKKNKKQNIKYIIFLFNIFFFH